MVRAFDDMIMQIGTRGFVVGLFNCDTVSTEVTGSEPSPRDLMPSIIIPCHPYPCILFEANHCGAYGHVWPVFMPICKYPICSHNDTFHIIGSLFLDVLGCTLLNFSDVAIRCWKFTIRGNSSCDEAAGRSGWRKQHSALCRAWVCFRQGDEVLTKSWGLSKTHATTARFTDSMRQQVHALHARKRWCRWHFFKILDRSCCMLCCITPLPIRNDTLSTMWRLWYVSLNKLYTE